MCGIAGLFGNTWKEEHLRSMVSSLNHRGPDAQGIFIDAEKCAGLGHNRLSIIDLSDSANQPFSDISGRYWLVYNGEVYNYLELKNELKDFYSFRTTSDSEVVLAAYLKWGPACLDRFIGMFAFLIWDIEEQKLFAARDRFGVKPFYYSCSTDGSLAISSEIKALHNAGIPKSANELIWSTYLSYGTYDHSEQTFWQGISKLPAGEYLFWQRGKLERNRWYNLHDRVGDNVDQRSLVDVKDTYTRLLEESVNLRFRADVPVGVCLSGGLDSSALLSFIRKLHGDEANINIFTFTTGDPYYDELPWVEMMLSQSKYPLTSCLMKPEDVPELASEVAANQDEPFGGFPTLAYANLFKTARKKGVYVLLDGQGMDEQLAGYDYYQPNQKIDMHVGPVQGAKSKSVLPHCLDMEFRKLSEKAQFPEFFKESLRNLQYRDIQFTKIPRALRFNDHASMMSSCELREPFLCHRLVEAGFQQPSKRKIRNQSGKWLLREIVQEMMPAQLSEAPKRPVQTPQREWLQDELSDWAEHYIDKALTGWAEGWLDKKNVLREWEDFRTKGRDNSFPFWQWINLGLMQESK